MEEETRYWIGFSVFPGIGPVRFKLLLDYFGTAKAAWLASEASLRNLHMSEKLIDEFVAFRREFDIEVYSTILKSKHVGVLTLRHPKYPAQLKEIPDAPFVLYVLGGKTATPIDLRRTIGVVGTRKITAYGAEVTRRLTTQLVQNGFTIVSGLAYGVDAVAHQAAIDAGGNTIAVLGCGVDVIAPASNTNLYTAISSGHGCIVSEMPLSHRPGKGLFPARNRIISGLSLGVLVTEGADDSGALITARNAAEQGRDVFAIPGPITSAYSKGPARLLKQGAVLVEDIEDIMNALGLETGQVLPNAGTSRALADLTDTERCIVQSIEREPHSIDEIARITRLTIASVGSTITILEIRGVVKDIGDRMYCLV